MDDSNHKKKHTFSSYLENTSLSFTMSDMIVAYPHQLYNTLMIVVGAMVIIWGFRVVKRVYRMLRTRAAFLTERVINIRGMGSYLSYFEGASNTHLNSVVHTRQSKPPVTMGFAYFPCTFRSSSLHPKGSGMFELTVDMDVAVDSDVFLLSAFNSANFKTEVLKLKHHFDGSGQSLSDKLFKISEVQSNGKFNLLHKTECCQYETVTNYAPEGSTGVTFELTSEICTWLRRTAAQGDESNVYFAIVVIPRVTTKKMRKHKKRAATGADARKSGGGVLPFKIRSQTSKPGGDERDLSPSAEKSSSGKHSKLAGGDVDSPRESDFSVEDDRVHILPPSSSAVPTSTPTTTTDADDYGLDVAAVSAGVVTLSLAVRQLRGSSVAGDLRAASPAVSKKRRQSFDPKVRYEIEKENAAETSDVPPPNIMLLSVELMLFDGIGNMFNAQEIFGLGTSSSSAAVVTTDDAVGGESVINVAKEAGEQAMQAVSSMASAVADAFIGSSGSSSNRTVSDASPAAAQAAKQGSSSSATSPAPITCSNGAVVGGQYTEEECVVCMCEPKSVVLLPCR